MWRKQIDRPRKSEGCRRFNSRQFRACGSPGYIPSSSSVLRFGGSIRSVRPERFELPAYCSGVQDTQWEKLASGWSKLNKHKGSSSFQGYSSNI
jgi:hypothetical protein